MCKEKAYSRIICYICRSGVLGNSRAPLAVLYPEERGALVIEEY